MANFNGNVPAANKPQVQNKMRFSTVINTSTWQQLIRQTIGSEEGAKKFVASITSVVATNEGLRDCDAASIISGALVGNALNLSPSPTLGQYYLVPYSIRGKKVRQFQIGWKGLYQLAMRSGQYKKITVMPVKEGELKYYNPFTDEIEFAPIDDEIAREQAKTTGYYAMFELMNGYRKVLYWSREKMEKHAMTYSKSYARQRGTSFWEKDFDEMACKTMLRQLIGKWGIMSTEFQTAYEKDMAVIDNEGEPVYIDNGETLDGEDIKAVTKEVNQTVTESISFDELEV